MSEETPSKPAPETEAKLDAKPEATAPVAKAAKPAKPAKEPKAPKAAKESKAAPAGEADAAAPAPKTAKSEAGATAGATVPVAAAAPTAAELLADDTVGKKIIKAKGAKNIVSGIANILATFNNTQVTITDMHGNLIGWSTAGRVGFKGSRKSTAYAAQVIAGDAAKKAQLLGMKEVEVRIKGPGAGRESAVRGIVAVGMEVNAIKDITPVPHNGCRPPKRRRV